MRQTRRLSRTIACAMTLAVGDPGYPAAQTTDGGGSSALKSYALEAHHIEIQTMEGLGRIVQIGEHSHRGETDGKSREVAYEETKDLKRTMSTRKMSTRTKVLFGVAIAGTVIAIFLIWSSAESAN